MAALRACGLLQQQQCLDDHSGEDAQQAPENFCICNAKHSCPVLPHFAGLHRLDQGYKLPHGCQYERILLLMDNATSHAIPGSDSTELHGLKCISLSNITIVFLPLNTTSVIQPLDAGITAAFKQRYRAELLRWYVQQFDSDPTRDLSKQLADIRQAITWSAQVWQDISEQTIRNCWRKVQIHPPTWSADINNLDERERARQSEAVADLSSLISSLNLGSDALQPEEYEAFPGEDEVGEK